MKINLRRWNYQIIITSAIALATVQSIYSETFYVDVASTGASHPYNSWGTAATTIQDAVNAASSGDIVLVASGTYATGSTPTPGASIASRLVITKSITVQSVAGANMTTILGEGDPGEASGLGANAIRCVYMNSGVLEGFTLENGHTSIGSTDPSHKNQSGGAAVLELGGVITNCILTANKAGEEGGAAILLGGGQIVDSAISGNYAERFGGGTALYSGGLIEGCSITTNVAANNYGGGIFCNYNGGVVRDCTISDNSAKLGGGGIYFVNGLSKIYNSKIINNSSGFAGGVCFRSGEAHSCLIANNSTTYGGGGVSFYSGGKLYNSTVANNSGSVDWNGGGIELSKGGYVHNSIVWGNTGKNEFFTFNDGSAVISIRNTCASEGVVNGVNGCTTANPDFIDAGAGNYRLTSTSPCIDTGNDTYVSTLTDVDGQSRKLDGDADSIVHVDIGAYEYISEFSDSDTDGVSDWDEYVADTDAPDSGDFFRILNVSLTNGEVAVSFRASINRIYSVQFRESISDGDWENLSGLTHLSDLDGLCQLADTNTIHDTGFYKVKVELP